MSRPRNRPRSDQIAELTRGIELPVPALKQEHLTAVTQLEAETFTDIRSHHPSTVASGTEP